MKDIKLYGKRGINARTALERVWTKTKLDGSSVSCRRFIDLIMREFDSRKTRVSLRQCEILYAVHWLTFRGFTFIRRVDIEDFLQAKFSVPQAFQWSAKSLQKPLVYHMLTYTHTPTYDHKLFDITHVGEDVLKRIGLFEVDVQKARTILPKVAQFRQFNVGIKALNYTWLVHFATHTW